MKELLAEQREAPDPATRDSRLAPVPSPGQTGVVSPICVEGWVFFVALLFLFESVQIDALTCLGSIVGLGRGHIESVCLLEPRSWRGSGRRLSALHLPGL